MTLSRRTFFSIAGLPLVLTSMSVHAVPTKTPNKYDGEYDVVIVGAGGAGLSAACAAAENGAKVLVLEKNIFVGGSSLITDGMFATQGTKDQKKKGIEDSPELYAKDLYETGLNFSEKGLPEALAAASLKEYEWLTEVLGVKPFALVHQGGSTVPRCHQFKAPDVIKAMEKYAKERGVVILNGLSGKRLFWDDVKQKICGVLAVTNKGENKNYLAKKAVILTSGGFSRNPDVLKRFNPYLKEVQVLSGSGSMGEGLLMAQAYGADVRDMNFIEATFGAKPGMKSIDELSFMHFSGGIVVNKNSKRFVNESKTYMEISHEAVRQPGGKVFTVFDKAIAAKAVNETPELARMWKVLMEGKVLDYVFSGNSVEEVARKAGLDGKALAESIDKYNADVEKGRDLEYGREHLEGKNGKLLKISEAPFYIFPTSNAIFGTYCGLLFNPKAQVIDVFGDPIPGLYAAGEVTGGLHGAGYVSGSGYAKALSFGRVAGLEASSQA